ncbi:MAG: hypothetical protein ACREDY_03660 [Bradyrhizobium sp.]
MNRRGFLKFFGAGLAGAAIADGLLELAGERKIFLPPRSGWPLLEMERFNEPIDAGVIARYEGLRYIYAPTVVGENARYVMRRYSPTQWRAMQIAKGLRTPREIDRLLATAKPC